MGRSEMQVRVSNRVEEASCVSSSSHQYKRHSSYAVPYTIHVTSHVFTPPHYNTQLYDVVLTGNITSFELFIVKFLHLMLFASNILKYWLMQYAILNFRY